MRKILLATTLVAIGLAAAAIAAQAQPYGPGMMRGDGPAYRGGY